MKTSKSIKVFLGWRMHGCTQMKKSGARGHSLQLIKAATIDGWMAGGLVNKFKKNRKTVELLEK